MSADPRWTDETEALVSELLGRHVFGHGHMASSFTASDQDWTTEAILTALASAGILLAPGGDTRVERGKKIPNGGVSPCTARCRQETDHVHDRERTVWTGPWVEVKP